MAKSFGGVLINEALLSNAKISRMISNEGVGLLVIVCMYLKRCFHAIGFIDDVQFFSNDVKKIVNGVKKWIRESDAFVVDDENGVFYMPLLRKTLKLELCPSAREPDVVQKYGNKIKKEPEKYTAVHPVESVKKSSADDCAMTDEALTDEKLLVDEEKVFEKRNSQHVDNKAVNYFPTNTSNSNRNRTKGIGIIAKRNNTTIPTSSTVSAVDSSAAAGAEKSSFNFLEKKLISNTKWRKSTSNTRGINLEDDNVLHFFAKWMCDYCISNNTMPRDENEILHYASSLLTKGLRTRKCFDEAYRRDFLHEPSGNGKRKAVEEQPVYGPKKHSGSFEQLINGRRVGLDGQILPPHAPRLHNLNNRWSYRKNCYVDVSVWDKDAEEKARKEWEKKEREKEHARRMKFLDMCRRGLEREAHGATSVGDGISSKNLPETHQK